MAAWPTIRGDRRLGMALLWAVVVTPLTFGVNFASFTPDARWRLDEARAYVLQRDALGTGASASSNVDAPTAYLLDRASERARHRRDAPLSAWLMVLGVSVMAGGSLPLLLGVASLSRRLGEKKPA